MSLKSPILEPMRFSLWPAMTREPTKAELYDRCHLMGDIVVSGLGKPSTTSSLLMEAAVNFLY